MKTVTGTAVKTSPWTGARLLLAFALLGVPVGAQADGRVKVSSAADLPAHSYAVASKARPLAEDPEVVTALAAAVTADITADLAKYDISDRNTLRGMYGTLLVTAMLQKDFPAARRDVEATQSLEDKPTERAVSGLLVGALIDALQSPGTDFHQALRADVERAFRAAPSAPARDYMRKQKEAMGVLSRDVIVVAYAGDGDADAATGHISRSQAVGLLTKAFALQYIVPNRADLIAAHSAVLASGRDVPKPDIWAARDVTLAPSAKLTPVTVAVWDSGVDVSLYRSQLVPGSPGIAYDAQARPAASLLYPLPGGAAAAAAGQALMKGASDFQEGVDSPASAAYKAKLSAMTPDQMADADADVSRYESYVHGTHIAGIALRGNPAARLLVCRVTWEGAPSAEQAGRDAAMFRQSVAYFKERGARVVNMSWNIRPGEIETALEKSDTGETPTERRVLARKIYDIGFQSISEAIRSAPGILFVASAGNEDQDVLFNGSCPAAVKAPNLLVVGAVDQSGAETPFTSFGNVDVYANGVAIPSFVPGGATLKLSGTSMAAPQVTNLAAKMLADHPALTVAQVKAAILGDADRRAAGGKTILLINPRRTLAALARRRQVRADRH